MPTIATHNGLFHADEVFACATIRIAAGGAVKVVRSRRPEDHAAADWVVDVGGEYSPRRRRYDHHQWRWKEGEGEVHADGTPRSSFGLVWAANALVICLWGTRDLLLSLEQLAEVAAIIDRTLVREIDGLDTGYTTPPKAVTCLSHVISSFNTGEGQEDEDFQEALAFAAGYLVRKVRSVAQWVVDRAHLRTALEGPIADRLLVLDRFVRWKAELARHTEGDPRGFDFVIYPSGGSWRVEQIPVGADGQIDPVAREGKIPLPAEWRAKSREELQQLTGVEDVIFVHPSGFIGGAGSREGAVALARQAQSLHK